MISLNVRLAQTENNIYDYGKPRCEHQTVADCLKKLQPGVYAPLSYLSMHYLIRTSF